MSKYDMHIFYDPNANSIFELLWDHKEDGQTFWSLFDGTKYIYQKGNDWLSWCKKEFVLFDIVPEHIPRRMEDAMSDQGECTPETNLRYQLGLANEKLAEQAFAIIAELRAEKKGLVDALKAECSCMGDVNYSGKEIKCYCCEAIKKYRDEK